RAWPSLVGIPVPLGRGGSQLDNESAIICQFFDTHHSVTAYQQPLISKQHSKTGSYGKKSVISLYDGRQ
ncbi:MAG: hypothetical protein ACTIH0_08410, partial [Psychrobacter celer]